jgi:hypothetical protein
MAAAHQIFISESPARYRLEALIFTGESDITISQVLRMSCHTARAYRKIFCDIDAVAQGRLQFSYCVFAPAMNQYDRWKAIALARGISSLFMLWSYEAGCQPTMVTAAAVSGDQAKAAPI